MKHISCAVALSLAFVSSAWAEILPLPVISQYLNGLSTAQAEFTQINDDGSVSTGTLYIKRPGRMRFEYNPPETALVIAGSGSVVIVDIKSNQPPETYPLRRTPLSLILARDVNLSRAKMVVGHSFDGAATIVTAQDPKRSEYGSIQMLFTADPVELREWVITDASGGQTTVVLGDLELGAALSDKLFDVRSVVRKSDR